MERVTGFHAIEESLRADRGGKLYVSGKGARIDKLVRLAKSSGLPVVRVGSKKLDELAPGLEHRGAVFFAAEKAAVTTYQDLKSCVSRLKTKTALAVALDGITDPHNLGAVLRSADLFEVDFVIIPAKRSAQLNPTVVKTSAGASNYVPVVRTQNVTRALQELKRSNFWIYGADASGTPAYRLDLSGRIALVMGSEGSGLSRLVREECDELIGIPTGGNIDSLNVSVAAGVCMYEVRRQQRLPGA
jgi:23S rRNA (guanosine2251-2'-O)-methyltransferase